MKKLFIALLVMVGLVSCNGGKSFKINVNLENSDGKTVYLKRYENDKMVTLDSVVAKDNVAVFKVKQSSNLDALHIMMKGWRRPLTFFADNQDVTITGDYQKYNGIKVLASENQNKLNQFMADVDKIDDEKEIFYFVLDFVKMNIDNPVGAYALYRYKWAFQLNDLENIYEVIPADMQSGYKCLVSEYMKGLQRTREGMPYLDFKLKDVNGNEFAMASVFEESKVVILDFWASWCPDCRKANPELVAIYNEFKNKGLDIVSVSLDTDVNAWKKAIEDDNLSWKHHVSDLKGWQNYVAELYTIAYIPQTLIIDKNSIIVEKNLPVEKMRDLISSLLK
ncbi:MAG: AhpC/TSA family protein [Bacteroidales bacterium]|nr:AhpC/TSA family protein [Bacteroidales bacterium]